MRPCVRLVRENIFSFFVVKSLSSFVLIRFDRLRFFSLSLSLTKMATNNRVHHISEDIRFCATNGVTTGFDRMQPVDVATSFDIELEGYK